MELQTIIGLEIHIELKTKTKLFCSCPINFDVSANTNICPICLGHPGVLPVLNQEAVKKILFLGLALKGTIPEISSFDRKSYFYPDLPKGYQISQFFLPLVKGGCLGIDINHQRKKIWRDDCPERKQNNQYSFRKSGRWHKNSKSKCL